MVMETGMAPVIMLIVPMIVVTAMTVTTNPMIMVSRVLILTRTIE